MSENKVKNSVLQFNYEEVARNALEAAQESFEKIDKDTLGKMLRNEMIFTDDEQAVETVNCITKVMSGALAAYARNYEETMSRFRDNNDKEGQAEYASKRLEMPDFKRNEINERLSKKILELSIGEYPELNNFIEKLRLPGLSTHKGRKRQ